MSEVMTREAWRERIAAESRTDFAQGSLLSTLSREESAAVALRRLARIVERMAPLEDVPEEAKNHLAKALKGVLGLAQSLEDAQWGERTEEPLLKIAEVEEGPGPGATPQPPEPPKPEDLWTPVEEGNSPHEQLVWTTNTRGEIAGGYFDETFGEWHDQDGKVLLGVIAWHPYLPRPFRRR